MRLALILGVLSSTNILITFIYQWYVVTRIGPGWETDALIAGMGMPQFVLAVVCSSLVNVLIPLLSSKEDEQFHRDTWIFFQAIGLLFFVISGLLFATAEIWVSWIVPGFDKATTSLTIHLLRIQLFGIVFDALSSVLLSANNARNKFVSAECCAVLANILSLIFLIWGYPHFGVEAAAWAMVLRSLLVTLLLFRNMGPYHRIDLRSDSVKEAWKRIQPLVLGTLYFRTGHLVDRFFASLAPRGLLTLYHLSQQIYSAGSTISSKALVSPVVPKLSKAANQYRWSDFKEILYRRLLAITGVSIFGFLIILFLGKPLLALLFSYRRFDVQDVETLWWLLIALGGVWIGGAVGDILTSSFYAQGNTTTPTKIGTLGYSLGLLLKGIGFYMGGVVGLALGTSLYYFFNCVLLYVFYGKGMRQRALAA